MLWLNGDQGLLLDQEQRVVENKDHQGVLNKVLDVLRGITAAVKVTPFIYSGVFVVVLCLYNILGENVQDLIDRVFYISPFIILMMLIYSRILEMCIWHRLACIIPIVPQLADLIDSHYELTQIEVYSVNILSIILAIILIICGFKVYERRD